MTDQNNIESELLDGEGMDNLRQELNEFYKEGVVKKFFKKLFNKNN